MLNVGTAIDENGGQSTDGNANLNVPDDAPTLDIDMGIEDGGKLVLRMAGESVATIDTEAETGKPSRPACRAEGGEGGT